MPVSFTEPLSLTISAVTTPLPRISVEGDEAIYSSGDGTLKVTADHTLTGGKRWRRILRLDATKVSADPFRPAENVTSSMSCYIVFDVPPAGYTPAEQLAAYQGFKTMMAASSDALIVKLLGGES
jgi:hypothetical protein